MRTIKFRQKILDGNGNKSFHYWGFMRNGSFVSPIKSENGTYWTAQKNSEEYIGLSDKNGKMIFEGDLVGRGKVIYRKGQWWVEVFGSKPDVLLFNVYYLCEVIGNVYQNPDIIKLNKENL